MDARWLLNLLTEGALPGDMEGEGRSPGPLLYDDFVNATKRVGVGRTAWYMEVSALLREWIPGIDRREGSYQPPHRDDDRKRCRIWIFPPLGECRRSFDERTGETWDWDLDEDWLAEETDEM